MSENTSGTKMRSGATTMAVTTPENWVRAPAASTIDERVTAPAARAWSVRGRHMIQGIYRDLVLGTIADRCFTQAF
jgi:hypothetical protein